MAIPKFELLMRPLLVTLEDGAEWSSADIQAVLAGEFDLSSADLTQALRNGQGRFTNRVAWALHHLFRARLVERRDTSVYRITGRGREVLIANPTSVDVQVCAQFDEWHHSRTRRTARRGKATSQSTLAPAEDDAELEAALRVSTERVAAIRREIRSGSGPRLNLAELDGALRSRRRM